MHALDSTCAKFMGSVLCETSGCEQQYIYIHIASVPYAMLFYIICLCTYAFHKDKSEQSSLSSLSTLYVAMECLRYFALYHTGINHTRNRRARTTYTTYTARVWLVVVLRVASSAYKWEQHRAHKHEHETTDTTVWRDKQDGVYSCDSCWKALEEFGHTPATKARALLDMLVHCGGGVGRYVRLSVWRTFENRKLHVTERGAMRKRVW